MSQEKTISRVQTANVKDILALGVLLHHVIQFSKIGEQYYHFNFGCLFVAAFFALSGYGLEKQRKAKHDYMNGFLRNKLWGLYKPYLIATAIYVVVRGVLGITYTEKEILLSFIVGFSIVNFSWFVIELLGLYILYYLFLGKLKHLDWMCLSVFFSLLV